MIFRELTLQNFGPYQGRQTINLAPSETQPVVLFGGMNGGGKTTLMDALRLALYGQRALCSTRGNLSYGEFLNQCTNRHTTEPTQIELTFQHTLNNTPTEFRICRTWTRQPKQGRDILQVCKDGREDSALTKAWDEQIENLFPLGISSLFLFDGEQVKELADQDELPAIVVTAIRALLGLELPDRLSADLEVLVTRKHKELAQQQELQHLERIEQTLKTQEDSRRRIKKQVAAIQPKLDAAVEQLRLAEAKFLSDGGRIAAERSQLEAELQQATLDAETQREHLRELASGVLPLSLIQPLLQKAQPQIEQEIRTHQLESAKELLQAQHHRLMEFAQTHLKPKQQAALAAFLSEEQAALSQPFPSWLGADTSHQHQLVHLLSYELPGQQYLAQTHLDRLQSAQNQIESTERQLVTAAAPEAYEKLVAQVRCATDEVVRLRADLEQATRQLAQTTQEIAQTKQQLTQYGEQAIARKNRAFLLDTVAKVQDTLQLFKQRLKLRKLNQLETLVTECFLYLLHKSNLVHRVQIDAETFSLSLFDLEGEPVPKHRLSAGEKQLLAIALLWGLARASGRQLPVAIDTPLGRLDSSHRRHLVERYFPQASHQVLLFSTDTEIELEALKTLRDREAIASEYLLSHDMQSQATVVKSGYFW